MHTTTQFIREPIIKRNQACQVKPTATHLGKTASFLYTAMLNLSLSDFSNHARKLVFEVPNINNHNILELISVYSKTKKLMRLVMTDETYDLVQIFCEQTGLIQGHSTKKQAPIKINDLGDTFTETVEWDDPRGKFFVVIVGTKHSEVQKALSYENKGATFREFGELYQYPPCCIEAYFDLQKGEEWISAYLRRSPINVPSYYWGNRLATLFDGSTLIPDYFPCHLNCVGTQQLGKQCEAILRNIGWHEYLTQMQTSLLSPILIRGGSLLQLLGAQQSQNVIKYDVSKSRLVPWRATLTTDDPFWESNSLIITDNRLKLVAGNKILANDTVTLFDNRILQFH